MSVAETKAAVLNGGYDAEFSKLYADVSSARSRYAESIDCFAEIFGGSDKISLFSAPGRCEVGGNHTDHQHGNVLAGSINLDIFAAVSDNNDRVIRLKSKGFEIATVALNTLEPFSEEVGKSASLIRGMCAAIKNNGYNIGGFDAYTTSDVLGGSGLSSSAAFEVLVGTILNSLYNGENISAEDIAKFAQKAESQFFGKPCGLLDQMACSLGGFIGIDFNDPTKPVVEKVDFDLKGANHSLCIINTGGNHSDLTGDYAAVTKECRAVSNAMGKDYLRDVDIEEFYAAIPVLREKCGDRAVLRAIHFFDDNKRAVEEKEALKSNDFNSFLRLINESGNSSYRFLQNVFSVSYPEQQGISLALALTERFLNGKGACRVHGGGFAGTIEAFVPNDMLDSYRAMIEKVFGQGSCYVLNIRLVGGYALTEK